MRSEKQIQNEELLNAAKSGDLARAKSAIDGIAEINAEDDEGYNPLMLAAISGNSELVQYLCDEGGDVGLPLATEVVNLGVNIVSRPIPIILAAAKGHLEVVKYLYEGSRPSLTEELRYYLLSCGHPNIIQFLIEQGENINLQFYETGNSPLHQAALQGNEEMVQWFSESGANVQIKNFDGNAPLHLVLASSEYSVSKKLQLVKILCQNGASVESINKNGLYPIDMVCAWDCTSIEDFLPEYCEIFQLLMKPTKVFWEWGAGRNSKFHLFIKKCLAIKSEHGIKLLESAFIREHDCLQEFRHNWGFGLHGDEYDEIETLLKPHKKLSKLFDGRFSLTEFFCRVLFADNIYTPETRVSWLISSLRSYSGLFISDLMAACKGEHKILKAEKERELFLELMVKSLSKFSHGIVIRFLARFSAYLKAEQILALSETVNLEEVNQVMMSGNEYDEVAMKFFELANEIEGEVIQKKYYKRERKALETVEKLRTFSLGILLMNKSASADSPFYIMLLLDKLVGIDPGAPFIRGELISASEIGKRQAAVECIIRNHNCESIRAKLELALGIEKPNSESQFSLLTSPGIFQESKRQRAEKEEKNSASKRSKVDEEEAPVFSSN